MKFTLVPSLFTNGVYTVNYGLKSAIFTIIDETYESGPSSARVARMICDIQTFDTSSRLVAEKFGSLVIGLGDENVAVTTSDSSLLGLLLSSSNMQSCVVELYE